MQLRFATGGAAEGWARVQMAASPFLVATEEAVLHDMAHHPSTLARYVVVEDGEVLGLTRLRAGSDGVPSLTVQVDPAHQGRGVGRLLLDRVLAVTGGKALTGLVNGDDRSLAVARHWGFEPEREHRVSGVDPRDAPAATPAPDGLRVVPLAEAGVEAVWTCHHAVADDDPSGLSRPLPLEEYAAREWDGPLHRADLGRAVLDGETVLAFSQVDVAEGRAWNSMTGCLPHRRGEGLATLAKVHALHALAAAGVRACATGNDAANGPMLAVNERLGYRPSAAVWSARRPAR